MEMHVRVGARPKFVGWVRYLEFSELSSVRKIYGVSSRNDTGRK